MRDPKFLYATLPRRLKASIIDGVVLYSLFILNPLAIGAIFQNETILKPVVMFAPPFILEPFLITYLGFTIGQYIFGIEVVRLDTRTKCPLLISFARYYTKLLLGSFSLFYMLFSKKHQAIHDHLANTVVILSRKKIERSPEFAEYGMSEQIIEENYIYPSPIRRFGFFILWYAIVSIALVILVAITADIDNLPKSIDVTLNIIFSLIFFALAFMAAKGYLPGAKRKKKELVD